MKKKKMSKNKLTEYIHELSGKSYKETRQICKAAKWDEAIAVAMAMTLTFDQAIEFIASGFNSLTRAINEMGEAFRKAMNNAGSAIQTLADSMRQSAENMIQNDT